MKDTTDINSHRTADLVGDGIPVAELMGVLAAKWWVLVFGGLAIGVIALGISFLIPPTFTAQTMFLPPQQSQSAAAASTLASLGALSGLAGGSLGSVKSTGDQYLSLLQSVNVQDRLVDRFKLMEEYDSKYRYQARKTLTENVRITLGKKDGLITVAADAHSPELAADLANAHVAELRRLTGELALTEAQQRRIFFESELKRTREQLTQAQVALQRNGFNPGALKTEPKAAAESYALVKAQATLAEVKLQTLRRALADSAPEVQQQSALRNALQSQLNRLEAANNLEPSDAGYIGRYREYKYQESLFELFSRQYELARLDESRESALIQVVDKATPPEIKSRPKRALIAIAATLVSGLALALWICVSHLRDSNRRAAHQASLP